MGVLLLRCPHTGRDLTTGIQTDAESFSRLPQVLTQTGCPHCGSVHFWLPREAKFAETISPRDWIENQQRVPGRKIR
jgi:hypothetical protein